MHHCESIRTRTARVVRALAAAAVLAAPAFAAPAPAAQVAPAPPPDAELLRTLRTAQGKLTGPICLKYGGEYEVEGHFSKPHETAKFDVDLTVSIRDGLIAWTHRMTPAGVTDARAMHIERAVLRDGLVYAQRGTKWELQPVMDATAVVHTIGSVLPSLVLANVSDATPMPGTPSRATLRSNTGQNFEAAFDVQTKHIQMFEWPRAHRRLGDISDLIRYADYEMRSGVAVPQTVDAIVSEDTSSYRVHLKLKSEQVAIDAEALDAITSVPRPMEPEYAVDLDMIAPGLWCFTHTEADVRCLVQEFDDGFIAFEAPLSSQISEQIIQAIIKRLPEKPLKAVAVSHYHPHYIGGLRAFVAAGCDIYTTPKLEPFVREILARPFTRQPDALARKPRAPTVHLVKNSLELSDKTGAVQMIDVGPKTEFAEEYLVFHFPRTKILFEGSLAYVVQNGKLFVLNWAQRMLDALAPLNLTTERVVQAWPAHDTPPQEWSTFVAAVARLKPAAPPAPANAGP